MADAPDHPDFCTKHREAKVRSTFRLFGRKRTRFDCPKCDEEAQARLAAR